MITFMLVTLIILALGAMLYGWNKRIQKQKDLEEYERWMQEKDRKGW